jgi:hypothetical protein
MEEISSESNTSKNLIEVSDSVMKTHLDKTVSDPFKKNFKKLSKNILVFLLGFLNLNDLLIALKLNKRFNSLSKEILYYSKFKTFTIFKDLIKEKYTPSWNVHKHLQTKATEIKNYYKYLSESDISNLITSYIYYRTTNKHEDFYRLSENKLDSLFEFYIYYYMKFIGSPICHLINLNLSKNLISQSSLHALSDAIGSNKSIVSLDLSYLTYDSSESYSPFQEAIARNLTLKKIICNHGKPNGLLESIFIGLTQNKSVQEIYACNHNSSAKLVTSLANCMHVNETLTTLSISNWNLEETEKIIILKSLGNNKTLQNFYFSGVNLFLHEESLFFFSKYIMKNKSLLNVNISNNTWIISPNTTKRDYFNFLFQALEDNLTLRTINLSSNKLDDSFTETICYYLSKNLSLKEVNLSLNEFTDSSASLFINLVKENKALERIKLIGTKISKSNLDQIEQYLINK